MTMDESLLEANTLNELEQALFLVTSQGWQAKLCHLLIYNEDRQDLSRADKRWPADSKHQAGACALQLRPINEQNLGWPEDLSDRASHRCAYPIYHFGSLRAVLLLGFDQEPEDAQGLEDRLAGLGSLVEKVAYRESCERFVERAKELLVQALEARGLEGHMTKAGRLCQALAAMLDCSPQVQSELLAAAQCHDIGLVRFKDIKSAEAQREHAKIGAEFLRQHPELYQVASLVEAHHERYDGSGLPEGKSGNELPLECWILALVEDLLESWESSLASYESKVKEFFTDQARHHHPDVVDALCGLIDSGRLPELV